ncbi:MAG: secondary thiamine-phosphate synthase enzyme YjbQ [Patescibacteria group bacterium]
MIETKQLLFESEGPFGLVNLTDDVKSLIRNGQIENGVINIYSHGSTTGVVVLGGEEGLEEDFINMMKRLVPDGDYAHDQKTATNNGVAHLRSTLAGTGVTIPFARKRIYLGMFQQIYFIDFDFVKREREVIVQLMGE